MKKGRIIQKYGVLRVIGRLCLKAKLLHAIETQTKKDHFGFTVVHPAGESVYIVDKDFS